jgi:glycosyltransferase involved in cell wall biosynthesis
MIVGSRPAADVLRLGNLPGVEVTGNVPDIRPYLAGAKVAVIPMRISQGIQNKILEAMAAGLPVVTTPAAAAGFHSDHTMPLAIAENPEKFAECVIRFLQQPEPTEQAEACRAYLKQYFDWDTNLSVLDELLNQAVAAVSRTA